MLLLFSQNVSAGGLKRQRAIYVLFELLLSILAHFAAYFQTYLQTCSINSKYRHYPVIIAQEGFSQAQTSPRGCFLAPGLEDDPLLSGSSMSGAQTER